MISMFVWLKRKVDNKENSWTSKPRTLYQCAPGDLTFLVFLPIKVLLSSTKDLVSFKDSSLVDKQGTQMNSTL
jgi:hypothetical protein